MLDIKADPGRPGAASAPRSRAGTWPTRVDELLAADERRRALTVPVDELRAEQNKASKAIGRAERRREAAADRRGRRASAPS